MKKGCALALAIIALFGAARMGFEQQLTEEHRAGFFHGARINLNLRQQIGQLGFLAALSGFRSVVADCLWIQVHSAWQRTEWGRMLLMLNNVTALQPRNVMFWDMAAWHMGWNASVSARENRRQPREALRIKAQREYFKVAEDFLIRGIENNPDRYELYERLATLYRDKFEDHHRASEWYDKAKNFPRAPSYEKRFAAYELSHCPDREQEAYERLVKLYKMGENERLPTLLTRLQYLQEKLNIPPEQRVYNPRGN
jgi:hypothetical protein